jgi:hypothetical protein
MKSIIIFGLLFIPYFSSGHHYKGLPHYSYFDNYPQVPVLEFTNNNGEFEIFSTVYNFQGLNIDKVDSPDDVRFYSYISSVKTNRPVKVPVNFKIIKNGETLYESGPLESEQEYIYVVQTKLNQGGDLDLVASFTSSNGVEHLLTMPVRIKESVLKKYATPIGVGVFFLLVMLLKISIDFNQRRKKVNLNPAEA